MTTPISIEAMFKAGVHYGHNSRYWNPKMAPYIYGESGGIHLHDLHKTQAQFNDALDFLTQIVQARGVVVFVGTKSVAQNLIRHYAKACHMPYVDQRWLGGMLTNFKTIRLRIRHLAQLEKRFEKDDFRGLTKKERLMLARERKKLDASIGGIRAMKSLPEALFVVDAKEERNAIREANCLGIPVVALVDTNSDPDGIDYVIPANDDAHSSVRYFIRMLSERLGEIKNTHHEQDRVVEQQKAAKKATVVVKKKTVNMAKEKVATQPKPAAKKAAAPAEAAAKPVAKPAEKSEQSPAKKAEAKPAAKGDAS